MLIVLRLFWSEWPQEDGRLAFGRLGYLDGESRCGEVRVNQLIMGIVQPHVKQHMPETDQAVLDGCTSFCLDTAISNVATYPRVNVQTVRDINGY